MGRLWLLGGIAMVLVWVSLFAFPETTDWWTDRDNAILRQFVDARNSTLTSIADAIAVLGSSWFLRLLRIGTVIALLAVRRLRHFFAVILAIILVQETVEILKEFIGRPRPFVPIIGDWMRGSTSASTIRVMQWCRRFSRSRSLRFSFAGSLPYPVTWKPGVTAHLDVSGERGEANKRAIGEKFGMEVLDIKPFGLEGSGGSDSGAAHRRATCL